MAATCKHDLEIIYRCEHGNTTDHDWETAGHSYVCVADDPTPTCAVCLGTQHDVDGGYLLTSDANGAQGAVPASLFDYNTSQKAWNSDGRQPGMPSQPDAGRDGYSHTAARRNAWKRPGGWTVIKLREVEPEPRRRSLGFSSLYRNDELAAAGMSAYADIAELAAYDADSLERSSGWPGDRAVPVERRSNRYAAVPTLH